MTAIEAEEKPLRMKEERNDIYELINALDDVKSEGGKELLRIYTERFEKTFAPDSDDEDGISDDVVRNSERLVPQIELQRLA